MYCTEEMSAKVSTKPASPSAPVRLTPLCTRVNRRIAAFGWSLGIVYRLQGALNLCKQVPEHETPKMPPPPQNALSKQRNTSQTLEIHWLVLWRRHSNQIPEPHLLDPFNVEEQLRALSMYDSLTLPLRLSPAAHHNLARSHSLGLSSTLVSQRTLEHKFNVIRLLIQLPPQTAFGNFQQQPARQPHAPCSHRIPRHLKILHLGQQLKYPLCTL